MGSACVLQHSRPSPLAGRPRAAVAGRPVPGAPPLLTTGPGALTVLAVVGMGHRAGIVAGFHEVHAMAPLPGGPAAWWPRCLPLAAHAGSGPRRLPAL